MKKFTFLIYLIWVCPLISLAQQPGETIDEVAAIVGNNVVLQSEIEFEFAQARNQLGEVSDTLRCSILRQKIQDYVLVSKAQTDSVELSDERVNMELEKRIRYFASQFTGGEKGMEEFYGKSVSQIKADNREKIKNSLLIQEMQGKALRDVKVSPTDIKKLYNEMSEDSLPFYSAEVEVAQIVIEPKVTKEAKEIAYQKISEIRDRIIGGETFNTLALIYSDDKGTASRSGELGYFSRGDMVPEFEAAAFRLKPDSVSKIIETKYGYHILRLIDRKGENINVRHILIRPQIFRADIERARKLMDSIIWLVKIDSMKFEDAAKKFSDDVQTKSGGGFITEGQTGSTKIPVDEMDKELYFRIEKLQPGEISEPETITLQGPDQQQAWRVLYLKSESAPHRANLKDDYQKFQAMATQQKQAKALSDYLARARKEVFIKVSDNYKGCKGVRDLPNK